MAETILIVEDDPRIAELVAKNLRAAGFECHRAPSGELGLQDHSRLQPDLVVLDVGLPGLDGLEFTRRIRQKSSIPILMLTARTTDGDKVLGFELGADDYVTKPFSTVELVARVRALLRRTQPAAPQSRLDFGDLVVDAARREVRVLDQPIELTSLEFDLLLRMATHPGVVFTREQLLSEVWGEDRVVDDRSIDSLVSRLRRKLEPNPSKPRYVQTVWGAGYRFTVEDSG